MLPLNKWLYNFVHVEVFFVSIDVRYLSLMQFFLVETKKHNARVHLRQVHPFFFIFHHH